MNENKMKIREFFSRFFRTVELTDTTDIFEGGLVNSLFAMQLIAWLEKEFGIAIENDDLNISNFNSIEAISNLLDRKNMIAAG